MCSNLKKFDLRWSRWTVKHESMFEVALVFFVYKRIAWNPCSRDNPFGKEDYVDIKPWVICISVLVLVDFCSKVNSFYRSFFLTTCKPLDNNVVIFVVYVFYTVSSVLPLMSPFEFSHRRSNLIPIFPWLEKTVHVSGEAPYRNMTIFISCNLMMKMQ